MQFHFIYTFRNEDDLAETVRSGEVQLSQFQRLKFYRDNIYDHRNSPLKRFGFDGVSRNPRDSMVVREPARRAREPSPLSLRFFTKAQVRLKLHRFGGRHALCTPCAQSFGSSWQAQ